MKNVPFSVFAVLLLILAAGQSATAQEKYTLKNAYPPGQYELVMSSDMDMTVEMSGAKMPMKVKQTQYMMIDAAEKNADGTQKIVMEITRIVMSQKVSLMNIEYDSADPDSIKSPMKAAGVVVGLKVTTLLDKEGVPIKVEGMDEFFEKLANDPDYPKPVAEMLRKQMTDESMTQSLDMAREMVPKEPVAVGETWKTEGNSEIPMLGKAKTNLENTLKEIKTENGRKYAVIASKSLIHSEEPREMEVMPGTKMTFSSVDINGETTVLLDMESGFAKSSAIDMEIAMEMSMGLGDKTIKQKISGKNKTTVTVEPKQSSSAP